MTENHLEDMEMTEVEFTGSASRVAGVTIVTTPTIAAPSTDEQAIAFTRSDFEGALDKATRPVKGKYADVPYSSEDLIRDKKAEVELEDRKS